MIQIKLYTRNIKNKKPGKKEYVTTLILPPFDTFPDAVTWGNRTFFLEDVVDGIYVEGWLWHATGTASKSEISPYDLESVASHRKRTKP